MQIAAIASILVYVSLWEYMMAMYRVHPLLPYRAGYTIFAVLQWPVIAMALIHIFGWGWGVVALIFTMTVLQYITHFSLGLAYNFLFKNPLIPLAIFGIMFWVNIAITVLLLLFA